MPLHRKLRLLAASTALAGLTGVGLADWSQGSAAYVVRPGDSLWSIAKSHQLTVAQLAAYNGLNPNDILPIGHHLRLAATSSPPPPRSAGRFQFCASFSASPGPWGVLPAPLAGSSTYSRLAPVFTRWSSHYDVSRPLLEAVAWQESGWQQDIVSPTGAVGVGQIEPYTARFIQADLVGQSLDINSASDNIRMSAAFLGYLAHVEGNNRCATIAAYYEGPLNLQTLGVLPSAQQYVADVEALEARFEGR